MIPLPSWPLVASSTANGSGGSSDSIVAENGDIIITEGGDPIVTESALSLFAIQEIMGNDGVWFNNSQFTLIDFQ